MFREAAFHKVLEKPLRNDYSHNSFPVFLAEKCPGNKQFLNSRDYCSQKNSLHSLSCANQLCFMFLVVN